MPKESWRKNFGSKSASTTTTRKPKDKEESFGTIDHSKTKLPVDQRDKNAAKQNAAGSMAAPGLNLSREDKVFKKNALGISEEKKNRPTSNAPKTVGRSGDKSTARTTATFVSDQDTKKEPEKKPDTSTMSISSELKTRIGGFAATKGKAVKREAGSAKDTLASAFAKKDSAAGKTPAQTAKDALSKKPEVSRTNLATPANTGTSKDTKTSAPSASTGKGGFMSKVKSGMTSKERINAALAWAGGKGGKTTAKPDTTKTDAGKTTTTKTDKSKTKTQKAKKNKAAVVKSETISGPFNATEAMKARRAAAEAAGKGRFNATEEMKKRRAAAEAAGKGKFNATEEMKKRRAAAEAQGKGKWNAQEEMRKRREAAESRKRIQNAMNGKGK